MLKRIKNITVRRAILMRVLILLMISAVLIGSTGFRILDVVRGPSDPAIERIPPEELREGEYIQISDYVIVAQSEEDGVNISDRCKWYLVVVNCDRSQFYMNIRVRPSGYDRFDELMREQTDFLSTGKGKAPECFAVSGVLRAAPPAVRPMLDTQPRSSVSFEGADLFIDDGILGFVPEGWVVALSAAGAAALLAALVVLVKALSGGYLLRLIGYADKNLDGFVGRMEKDYIGADCYQKTFVGDQWLIYFPKMRVSPKIISLSEIVWAYVSMVVSRRTEKVYLALHTKKRRVAELAFGSQSEAKQALERLFNGHPDMVAGYSRDIKKLYRKNKEGFAELAAQQHAQEAASDEEIPVEEAAVGDSALESVLEPVADAIESADDVAEQATPELSEPVAEKEAEQTAAEIDETSAREEQTAAAQEKDDASSLDREIRQLEYEFSTLSGEYTELDG